MSERQLDLGIVTERKVTDRVLLDLIRDGLTPGAPNLTGGMWGWFQPNSNEETVKLGGTYGGYLYRTFTVREVMEGTDLGYEQAAEILRECRRLDPDFTIDTPISNRDFWFYAEEVFMPFGALAPEIRPLVRLKILVVNGYCDVHNWACEFGDSLADQYCDHKEAQLGSYNQDGWSVFYDYLGAGHAEADICQLLLDAGIGLPIRGPYESGDWYMPKPNAANADMVAELIEEGNLLPEFQDCYSAWEEEIAANVLARLFEYLQEDAKAGNLTIDWPAYDAAHPYEED